MPRKLLLTLVAAALLVFGVGVTAAIADDDPEAPAPVACSQLAPGNDTEDAAKSVANAADNVSEAAETQEVDDDLGDVDEADADDNDGEHGDCDEGEDDDDEGDDD